MTDEQPVLEIRDLRVTFPTESGDVQAVRGVDVVVGPGEMLGVVGESGSGKSVTFLAAMGLLPKTAKIEGSVMVHGQQLVGMNNNEMRKQRGKRISMIFQDPLSALNPTHKIGHQISEMVRSHTALTKPQAWDRAIELLDIVGIPQPRTRVSQYPHEFSGGMRQRVMIAIAIANDPDVLIADEPTTALDVTVQAQILDVIQNIQHEFRASVVFITHDLGVVARIADRVQVMYAGRTVERGDVDSIFRHPTHPYTRGLLASLPALGRERLTPIPGAPPNMLRPPSGCAFRPRCPYAEEICASRDSRTAPAARDSRRPVYVPRNYSRWQVRRERTCRSTQRRPFDDHARARCHRPRQRVPDSPASGRPRHQGSRAGGVQRVSFSIESGTTLGLVGESGSGKSTVARCVLQLLVPTSGSVKYNGTELVGMSRKAIQPLRQEMQMVFQDPYASLDPRLTVGNAIAEPLQVHKVPGKHSERVAELLELVGLAPDHAKRFPHEFSGGQRQRVGVARALALEPKLIVLDEPVSALDVSIQAGVMNLLQDLQARLGLSYLFIAHDLSVVRHISDTVAVMYLGKVMEIGPAESIYNGADAPVHAGPAVGRTGARPDDRTSAQANRAHGRRAEPGQPAIRMPLPHPLPEGPRCVRRRGAIADRPRRRTPCCVLLPRGCIAVTRQRSLARNRR